MILVWLFESALWVLIPAFVITQVIIPILRGTAIFPLFNRRRRLEAQLRRAREYADEARLEKEVTQTYVEADDVRHGSQS
ncbi:MAG: hypothetical protein HYT47_00870 [Candidatus Vogelbacteria bacterium]|nr:hypothetical protein [Candidatus Vogelbacteria bacterium]